MSRTCATALIMLLLGGAATAMFGPVEVDNVPVERVTANLERQLAGEPRNVELLVNLARVHAMAFAIKSDTIPSVRNRTAAPGQQFVLWLGPGAPRHQQFAVRSIDDTETLAIARAHLEKAIGRYRQALSIAPDHLVAKLGLGWSLVQAGDRGGAVTTLREVIAQSWPMDENPPRGVQRQFPPLLMGQRSVTEEAALYLLPLLDPDRNREEIETLRRRVRQLERQLRAVTPMAIPLRDRLTALDIADDEARVRFDADGSGIPARWTWIRSNAAWLVFDRHGAGHVDSALQLFGSVTFWLFWSNGYHALRALDDDDNGEISGRELDGLALWHDRNGNGVSERGEVRPLGEWGIVSLSCAFEYDPSHPDEIAWSPRGVTFRDGTTRPTFDLVLRTPAR